jgi:hypothetical protein
MSVEERLTEECKRIGLKQAEFDLKIDEGLLKVDFWETIALAGADVYYILTGQTRYDQILRAIKASTEKMSGLALSVKCKAAIAQLLAGLYADDMQQVKEALAVFQSAYVGEDKNNAEAMTDKNEAKLTSTEKKLIDAYRKASVQDKLLMERLAQLTEKVIEANSGIAEDVIDGE